MIKTKKENTPPPKKSISLKTPFRTITKSINYSYIINQRSTAKNKNIDVGNLRRKYEST